MPRCQGQDKATAGLCWRTGEFQDSQSYAESLFQNKATKNNSQNNHCFKKKKQHYAIKQKETGKSCLEDSASKGTCCQA